MFDLYCHICDAVHVVDSSHILSTHRTSEGSIAYVRCPHGHVLAVDFERLNPYSWRNAHPQSGPVAA